MSPRGLAPASPRLAEKLREHDVKGERAIATAQGAIACFVMLLHLLAQVGKAGLPGNPWVILTLGMLIASSLFRVHLTKSSELPERVLGAMNVLDIAVFLALIWSYQFAYQHPAGGILKAPSLMLLFALIALRALRFHPRPILMAGGTALAGWTIAVGAAIVRDGTGAITRDYPTYLTSHKILIGAEVERLVALAAVVLLLAFAAQKSRKLLSTAAHASDYAEALDAAERHLEEANQARRKAEAAKAELDLRDAELSSQNERFNAALANMSQGLCMFDADMRLLVCNQRYADMYSLSSHLVKPGTTLREILEHRIASGVYADDPEQYIAERLAAVREKKPSLKVQEMQNGRMIAITHRPMSNGGWLATHDDVTELHQTEARLAHMVQHDALTNLPNRILLRERLVHALAAHQRTGRPLAVLALDLDRFKEINDTLGHTAGDLLLKQTAERLREIVDEPDTVARLGADEFVIVRMADDAAGDAAALAKIIQDRIGEPFDLGCDHAVIGASIGIAVSPADGTDADQLLKNADLALHRAKSESKGQAHFFAPEMDLLMQERRKLETGLRAALAQGEFELHYQPVVNLERNEVTAFEALLRWNHPERGRVSPAEFIPIAEETGLIVPIGEWTLREACAEAARWPSHFKVAVNVSAVHFKYGGLVQAVVGALAAAELPASRLELEITETVLLQDSDAALATLQQLHDLGVRIALDDFGTGYSSLSYLRSFPFDKIKIDRSFIGDLAEDNDDALAIIRSVARLGSSLGMTTTAEGVETARQLELVRAEGCTEMQGYYFSPPRPAAEIRRLFLAKPRGAASAA